MADKGEKEKRARDVEDLIALSDRERAEQKKRQPRRKKASRKSRNVFLAPSVMMFIICGVVILVSLIAFITTSWKISRAKDIEPTPTPLALETPEPTPFPTPKAIPDVPDQDMARLSEELSSLQATDTEWNKKEEDAEDMGLYFISKEEKEYTIYRVDSRDLCGEGYSLRDFRYIWINSEHDDFYTVINVAGTTVDLSDYYILVREEKGIYASRVIINCYEAESVILNNTVVTGTLLAPFAKISCDNTYVYGQLIGSEYEGSLGFKRDIVFTGYQSVMGTTHGVEFENIQIKKRVIELLKSQDTTGAYARYNLNTEVLERDVVKIMDLDLSNLGLRDFGHDLDCFSHVVSLNLGQNGIKEFDLEGFPNLQALYLNNTALKEIDLSPCQGLTILDISNTRFESVPDFSQVPRLEYLAAANAALTRIDYWSLQNIKYLDVSGNPRLTGFDFGALPLLEQLDISNCNLLNADLAAAKELWFLRISGNPIWVLDLDAAPSLVQVEAYSGYLTEITAREFLKRENVILLYDEHTAVKS